MSRPVSNKPFYLTERKSGPKNNVSETDVCQFISVMIANIRLNEHWKELTNRSWEYSNVPYRGFESIDKELHCWICPSSVIESNNKQNKMFGRRLESHKEMGGYPGIRPQVARLCTTPKLLGSNRRYVSYRVLLRSKR